MDLKDLLKGTITFTLASLITQVGAMLLLPLYSSIIPPAQYGTIGVLQPITEIVYIIAVFGFYAAERRDLVDLENKQEELGCYLFSIHSFLLVADGILLFLLVLPQIRKIYIPLLGLERVPFRYILISIINGILTGFMLMVQSYWQYMRRYTLLGISSIVAFIISNVVALGIIFSTRDGIAGKLLGGLLSQALILIILYKDYLKHFKLSFSWKFVVSDLNFGLPLVASGIMSIVISKGSRFIMSRTIPMDIIGNYTIAFTISSLLGIVVNAFNVSWIPQFFKMMDEGVEQKKINDYILMYAGALTILTIGAQLIVNDAAKIILSNKYNLVGPMVVLMLPAYLVNGIQTIITNYFQYYKITIYPTIILVFTSLSSLMFNIIFMPYYGIYTAIWIQLIINLIILIIYFIIIYIKFYYLFSYKKLLIMLLLTLNPLIIEFTRSNGDLLILIIYKLFYIIGSITLVFMIVPEFKSLINILIRNISNSLVNKE